MANLFRCGAGSNKEIERVPCFMTEGNDGNTLTAKMPVSYITKGYANTSKTTTLSYNTQMGYAGSTNICNIDLGKMLDCKWIIILSGGGSTTSGKYVSNYLMSTRNNDTNINFDTFKLEIKSKNIYFTPLHKIIGFEDITNYTGSYVMYLVDSNKEKSDSFDDLAGVTSTNGITITPSVTIKVPTSSFIWFNIQMIPLIEKVN